MKVGRKPEYPEKTLGDELQKFRLFNPLLSATVVMKSETEKAMPLLRCFYFPIIVKGLVGCLLAC